MNIQQQIQHIEGLIQKQGDLELSFRNYEDQISQKERLEQLIIEQTQSLDEGTRLRVLSEFQGWGPIESLMADSEISEIIINGHQSIWYEKMGRLQEHDDRFSSKISYDNFISRVCQSAHCHYTLDRPAVDGNFFDFRLHLVSEELTKTAPVMSLRRHPHNPWNFDSLADSNWASSEEIDLLKQMIQGRENFLVIGTTGSGKTSVLNACLQLLSPAERVLIIEDTSELQCPNGVSTKLLTRKDANATLSEINQMELLRQSLRMRPDRLVLGEIRGAEAKDLLMALSTGHSGSFASMHAADPYQALIRLEMLIQLGAPYWSLQAIRTLVFLSLQKLVIVARTADGKRVLQGIYRLSSREESGILIERVGR